MVYYNQAIGKEGGLLMDNEGLTQYTRIAISLAERIASGQLKEGEKLSGRSKLSPEYNVSPETIRRTLRLLADMKVVEVKEQSGVYVLSADNARRYLHNFADQTDIRGKQQQLKELLVRQEHLNRQMAALCRDILDETSQTPDALPNYYCRIPDDWPHSGTTVGALRFWQATGATIVAIRRGLSYIVSPGPYAELYAGDAVIFVGGVKAREAVSHFFANP
jgi:K+/H+ antiporter YhaU regulatory subunit KhtT